MESEKCYLKENVVRRPPVSLGWLVAALAAAAGTFLAAARVDFALPEPLTRGTAPPDRFIAEIAHEHLVNLTSIGPRVAGSYENEVLGVGVIVAAVKRIARDASPHVRVELDVQRASGAFPLAFLDGMNHVYSDVSNVVVRLSAAGAERLGGAGGAGGAGEAEGRRSALLLNCHMDTVPDSPGASDDGAGCAVLLETLRALAAARGPPRRAAVFLFNGAEENVLQASHGFITQHRWAGSVRAFINIEACGAGGREVLFQAGPHHPWIVEVYAGAAPHPFASSLAQELFQSGLIPADTDFRIFRDFGKLSGLDLAWSANGYVYHTALDTAARVSPAVLQRTGDNVLALARGMLASARLEASGGGGGGGGAREGQPVYFDVLGQVVVSARAPAALLAALAALALAALDVHLAALAAERELYIPRGAWWRAVGRGAVACAASGAAGVACAACVASLLHGAGAALSFYTRVWLLAPLYAAPGVAGSWMAVRALRRWVAGAAGGAGGWWGARAVAQGACACAGAALALCVLTGLRSGFLPWLWTALPAAAGCAASGGARAGGARGAAARAGGALLPALQTWYLAVGSLRMFVPVAGRAGCTPLPPDVLLGALTAALALAACSWLLPLVAAAPARHSAALIAAMWCACACACALALCSDLTHTYGADTPQRLMVYHTRRTLHAAPAPAPDPAGTPADTAADVTEHFYWVPQLDVNTPHSLDKYVAGLAGGAGGAGGAARRVAAGACAGRVYCGMPYNLPVLSLVPRSLALPAPDAPLVRLRAALRLADLNATHAQLTMNMSGAAHIVVIVAPGAGARLVWSGGAAGAGAPLASRGPGGLTYMFALHAAGAHAPFSVIIARDAGGAGGAAGGEAGGAARGTQVSAAAHAMFGERQRSASHARLLADMPAWVAPTGWGVDLHLYRL